MRGAAKAGGADAGNQLRAATALVVADLAQRLFLQDLNARMDDACRRQKSMARRGKHSQTGASREAATPMRSISLTSNPLGMPGARCDACCCGSGCLCVYAPAREVVNDCMGGSVMTMWHAYVFVLCRLYQSSPVYRRRVPVKRGCALQQLSVVVQGAVEGTAGAVHVPQPLEP